MFSKQIHYTQSQKTSDYSLSSQQLNQKPFRLENQQSVKAHWQKLKSDETDNDHHITRRDRTVKSITVLQEIFSCSNQQKLIKLVSSFLQSEQQLTQIGEQLDKQQIVSLFLKIHQQSPQLVQFLHLLYDSLFSLDSSVSSKIYTHQDVLKYMLLSNYEQIQGQTGQLTRILEILSEMQILNPDFLAFEQEFQIDMEEISNSFNKVQLRILFLVSSIDILRALKGSVALFERLEQFVFSQIKNNQIPNTSDMQTLVFAYILLSEQLDIANKLDYSKQAVEIIGKSSDYSIYELKKRFLNNAKRLSQKYLGSQVYDQISSINRQFSPGINRQSMNHFNKSENLSYQFLVNQLKMDYTLNNDENFQIDFKCNNLLTSPLIYQLIDKLVSSTSKKEKGNSNVNEQSQVEKKSQPIIVKKQISIKQLKQENMVQSQTQNYVSTPQQKNLQQMSQTQGFQSSQIKQHTNNIVKPGLDSNEFEILQNKLSHQQQELEELKSLYNTNMAQKKNDLNQTNQQNQQNDQLKKKIELLETNLVLLKNENTTYKKEKDQKQSEVNELRSFIQDLQEKQLKLEKLVQQQQQQYQQQQQQFQLQLQSQQQLQNLLYQFLSYKILILLNKIKKHNKATIQLKQILKCK